MNMTIMGKKYDDENYVKTTSSRICDTDDQDSSYDSDNDDFEAKEMLLQSYFNLTEIKHPEVSRTTSDTLAAEFEEYVTLQGTFHNHIITNYNPGYAARVEFALKLGYTEKLVQMALNKLGPDPDQNELLAELIKLGATTPKSIENHNENDVPYSQNENCCNNGHNNQSSNINETSAITNLDSSNKILRPIVIDGSNVAMSHGNKEIFSCRGIQICVDWFKSRGHKEITVFVPKWRKEAARPDNPITNQEILRELEKDRLLVFTPSRLVGGKRMVCYDDRYILRLASEIEGIVVSNDNYRDLAQENPEFRKVVEERILMYSFVNDRFMPPDDPLGRGGPTLDNFLKMNTNKLELVQPCPYAKKCTYGNKCKFGHPERGTRPHQSVTEKLIKHAQRHLLARGPCLSLPGSGLNLQNSSINRHTSLSKTKSWTASSTCSSSSSSSVSSSASSTVSSTSSSPKFLSFPTNVLKSKSVENVTNEFANSSRYNYSHDTSNQNRASLPRTINNSDSESINLHKKLKRQTRVNIESDLRTNQFRKQYYQQQPSMETIHQSKQSNHTNRNNINVQHNQLTRHKSHEMHYPNTSWDQQQQNHNIQHQSVTRIASAPESYNNWHKKTNNNFLRTPQSSNDQITNGTHNLQFISQHFLPPTNLTKFQSTDWSNQSSQELRNRLHYHLINIFPHDQVQAAMTMYPQETNPQKICATILAMFPKH